MTTKLLSAVAVLAVLASTVSSFAAGDVPVRNDKNRIVAYTNVEPQTVTAAQEVVKCGKCDQGTGMKSLFGTSQQSTAPANTKIVNDKNRVIGYQ